MKRKGNKIDESQTSNKKRKKKDINERIPAKVINKDEDFMQVLQREKERSIKDIKEIDSSNLRLILHKQNKKVEKEFENLKELKFSSEYSTKFESHNFQPPKQVKKKLDAVSASYRIRSKFIPLISTNHDKNNTICYKFTMDQNLLKKESCDVLGLSKSEEKYINYPAISFKDNESTQKTNLVCCIDYLALLESYADFYSISSTGTKFNLINRGICLHILNHVLKNYLIISTHSKALQKEEEKLQKPLDLEEFNNSSESEGEKSDFSDNDVEKEPDTRKFKISKQKDLFQSQFAQPMDTEQVLDQFKDIKDQVTEISDSN
jgi:hypothetical protein